jgi:Ricin-type beta-trefoil lectin domain
MRMRLRGLRLAAAGLATGLTLLAAPAGAALPVQAAAVQSTDRLDEVYYAQPHNTYLHSDKLTNWLDAGYRTVEIDVIDKEDWELNPKGPYVAHSINPGNQNCSAANNDRLGDCLDDVTGWLDRNPGVSVPLLVFIDMKANADPASAWKPDEIALLDNFVNSYLGNRLYTYRDLLGHLSPDGNRSGLKTKGWPTLNALKGKIIVVFTGGYYGDVNARMNSARKLMNSGSNGGPTGFLCPDVDSGDPDEISGAIDSIGEPDSSYFFCANMNAGDNDQYVLNRSAQWRQLIHQWGAAGDFSSLDYAWSYISVAHGASAIGWDVTESLTNSSVFRPGWLGSIPLVGKRRSLAGYFTLRTTFANQCVDVSNSNYKKGTALQQYTCNDSNAQKFVYTAEGQLRPKGNTSYCADVDGGKGKEGAKLNIWDCDGGDSEKWAINAAGLFANRAGNWGWCMDVTGGSSSPGTRLQLWGCSDSNRNQQFDPRVVPDF